MPKPTERFVGVIIRGPLENRRLAQNPIDQASILWSPNATSFLYLDKNGVPILLGSLDGIVLWDVRDVLAGAREVQWGGARY